MATRREWLIEQGLVKPGSRGRLPRIAQEALDAALKDGKVFDVPTVAPVIPKAVARIKQQAAAIEKRVEKHAYSIVWGWDKVVKTAIAFDSCAGCGKPIKYCTHDLPVLPKWLDSEASFIKPGV
jgi:hypothetical protein